MVAVLLTAALIRVESAFADDFSCGANSKTPESKVINTALAGVPAVVRIPQSVQHRPVILWHGLGAPADPTALMQALPLDDVPAIKVYLGLPLTGERAPQDEADSLRQRQKRDYGALVFGPIVLGAAGELPAVVSALREAHCLLKDDAVDLFGFSAGGSALLEALTEQKVRIATAITLNAPTGLAPAIGALEKATHQSYIWSSEARRIDMQTQFAAHAGQIAKNHPALLMLQGINDSVGSPQDIRVLLHALEPNYGDASDKERVKVVLLPGVTHEWAQPPSLEAIRKQVSQWLNEYGQVAKR